MTAKYSCEVTVDSEFTTEVRTAVLYVVGKSSIYDLRL